MKRGIGKVISWIGLPAEFSLMLIYGFWPLGIPLTLLTLPLLPFYFLGGYITDLSDQEDFVKANSHLPLSNCSLDEALFIWPSALTDQSGHRNYNVRDNTLYGCYTFHDVNEATEWLINNDYNEVILLKHVNMLHTFWIRK